MAHIVIMGACLLYTSPVYLGEVAEIHDGPPPAERYVWYGEAGKHVAEYPAVTMSVTKKPGQNAVAVADAVIKQIDSLKNVLIPADIDVKITRNYGETAVSYTHLDVYKRQVVMNQGKIEQIGSPQQVYDNPATPFVYQFLGNVNAFEGRVNAGVAKLGALEVPVKEFAQTHDSAVQALSLIHI